MSFQNESTTSAFSINVNSLEVFLKHLDIVVLRHKQRQHKPSNTLMRTFLLWVKSQVIKASVPNYLKLLNITDGSFATKPCLILDLHTHVAGKTEVWSTTDYPLKWGVRGKKKKTVQTVVTLKTISSLMSLQIYSWGALIHLSLLLVIVGLCLRFVLLIKALCGHPFLTF